jgi:hypothetical protein
MTRYRWQMLFVITWIVAAWLTFFGSRIPGLLDRANSDNQSFPSMLGNSMSPTLFGAHQSALCPHCGHINRFAAESFPAAIYFCGRCRDEIKTPKFESQPGDSVEVKSAETLNRWDIVLVRDPTEPLRIVKRLVAFPGEKLQIKLGDLWIDGKRIERTLTQILESRILLFANEVDSLTMTIAKDDSNTTMPVGWREATPVNSLSNATPEAKTTRIEFLYREPWNKTPDTQQRNRHKGAIVSDWYAENPAFSGSLWTVSDQILELCFIPAAEGEIEVGLRNSYSLSPQCLWFNEWKTKWSKNIWSSGETSTQLKRSEGKETCLQYVMAYVDGAYWLRVQAGHLESEPNKFIAERELLEWRKLPVELEAPLIQDCNAMALWALQFKGVERWHYRRVARDIYYRHNDAWGESQGIPMIRNVEGYYLLGDNQPISLDSRQKPGWIQGVPRNWIEGRISTQN